jgi:hypothetical protein
MIECQRGQLAYVWSAAAAAVSNAGRETRRALPRITAAANRGGLQSCAVLKMLAAVGMGLWGSISCHSWTDANRHILDLSHRATRLSHRYRKPVTILVVWVCSIQLECVRTDGGGAFMQGDLDYADALKILGEGNYKTLDALDRILGGAILVTSATTGQIGFLGLLGARDELTRNGRKLLARIGQRVRGATGKGRTDLLIAAHAVVAVNGFFEALKGVHSRGSPAVR